MTLAIMDMFSSMVESGEAEDILALVCKSLVRYIENIRFAFYCYAGDETGVIAAVQPGLDVFYPPPDVHRQLVARLRKATRCGQVSEISPQKAPSALLSEQRKKWRRYQCVAIDIPVRESRWRCWLSTWMRISQ